MTAQRGRKSVSSLQVVPMESGRKPPSPPAGLSKSASALWVSITESLPPIFFMPGDLPLLKSYCIASDRKDVVDEGILSEGAMFQGEPHPGLKVSRDEAALMASLAVKLRLCQSSRTRPDSASLKPSHTGARPWEFES